VALPIVGCPAAGNPARLHTPVFVDPEVSTTLTTFSRTRTFDKMLTNGHNSDSYTFSCTVKVDT
jgi:hypothetical protein